MTAAEVAARSGIPEQVIVEKFGLRGKHIAAEDEHVSDLSVRAARGAARGGGVDPEQIDVVMYYGSMWKDYAVWQAAPWIAHRIGASRAYAVEYDNVSCGTPVALRIARDMLLAEDDCARSSSSPRAASRTCSTTTNERSRFMFNFGDGAVAGLLVEGRRAQRAPRLPRHHRRLALAAGEGAIGRERLSERRLSVPRRRRPDGDEGQARRGEPRQLRRVLRRRARAQRRTLEDIGYLCGIHMKPSMHRALVAELGLDESRAAYLDDTGHMSGVDPLLALDRAARAGELHDGELVLLLAAGTGYTWAASVVRWGDD